MSLRSDPPSRIERERDKPKCKQKLECVFCEKLFSTGSKLRLHLSSHTMERCSFCTLCTKEFYTRKSLQKHIETHNQNGTKKNERGKVKNSSQSLEVCNTRKRQDLLSCKIVLATKPGLLCPLCPHRFLTKQRLQRHIEVIHNPNRVRKVKCNICQRRYFTADTLRTHLKMHNGKKPFACNICYTSYATEDDLNKHKATPDFLNGHTRLQFTNERKYSFYRGVTSTGRGDLNYPCIFCNKMFPRGKIAQFQDHLRRHIGERPYHCTVCPHESYGTKQLREHLATHNPNRTKDWKCETCGKGFYYSHNLSRHRKEHTPRLALSCQVCKKTFGTKDNLKAHSLVHSERKRLQCSMCTKGFLHRHNLYKHIRKHTGENWSNLR